MAKRTSSRPRPHRDATARSARVGIFDQSLKLLLQQQPEDFIAFALGHPATVERPLELPLPARGRELDGGYVVSTPRGPRAVQIEFLRRHLSTEEVALDVGEAQLRLYRREGLPVLPVVWDLYGDAAAPVLERRSLLLSGEAGEPDEPGHEGTCVRYLRVNLRALDYQELLKSPLRGLWALTPLCRGGASEAGVAAATRQIQARAELGPSRRADHTTVLYFLAEAEAVPLLVLQSLIEADMMRQSALYKQIIQEGVQQGREDGLREGLQKGLQDGLQKGLQDGLQKGVQQGLAQGQAELMKTAILRVLVRRLGAVTPVVTAQLRAETRTEVLDTWFQDALQADDAALAQRLHDRIAETPPPPAS